MSKTSRAAICLAEHRPAGFQGRGDKYLGEIAQDLARLLRKVQRDFTSSQCRVDEAAWSEIAALATEWAEDIHNGLGLWQAIEKFHRQWYGTPLPFLIPAGSADEPIDFDSRRLQFLFWHLWPGERDFPPSSPNVRQLAEAAANFLAEKFARLPRDSGLKHFFSTANAFAWDVRPKLIWLAQKSYLFRWLHMEFVAGLRREPSSADLDLFICEYSTFWSGLRVPEVLAEILDVPEPEREMLRAWQERHISFYRVLEVTKAAGNILELSVKNVVNGQVYPVRMREPERSVGAGECLFGALSPWRGDWHWSGNVTGFGNLPDAADLEWRRRMLQESSILAYRYCPGEAAQAREITRTQHEEFVKHYGGELKAFADGRQAAEAERERVKARRAANPEPDATVTKDAQAPGEELEFPQNFLENTNGIGAFSTPEFGVEFMRDFQPLLSGLQKKGAGLTDIEKNAVRGLVASDVLSVALVRRLVQDNGPQSILEAFCLRDFPTELALEFLLRCYKGDFYHRQYPRVAVPVGAPASSPGGE